MSLFKKTKSKFEELPKEKQEELLLRAAKSANQLQRDLENKYIELKKAAEAS